MAALYGSTVARAATLTAFLFAAAANAAIQIPEGGYLAAEHHDDLVMTPDGITVEGWFYLDEYPAAGELYAPLIMKPASYAIVLVDRPKVGIARVVAPGPYVQLMFYDMDSQIVDGLLFCGAFGGRSSMGIPDANPLPAAEWMHVAFEMLDLKDGGMLSYYLNGKRVGKLAESLVGGADAGFYIGGVPTPNLLEFRARSALVTG
jgi:hypothetical protein